MTCQASLKRDCDCVTHDGPHWLHMALADRRRSRQVLDRALAAETPVQRRHALALLDHWGRVERARIRDLIVTLRAHGWADDDPLPECLRKPGGAA